jgi:DNA-binding transcriptional ArsR family regulator
VAELTDPKSMRALAHPTRLALVEALLREGPLTATEAANLLDDSPGNISWHLGILSKYGVIEEVEAKGRRRPWRLTSISARFSTTADDGTDLTAAGEALAAMVNEQALASWREWQARRSQFEAVWSSVSYSASTITYLTPEELEALSEEVIAVLHRYRDRTLDKAKRPPGSRPVRLTAWGHPLPPNPSGS